MRLRLRNISTFVFLLAMYTANGQPYGNEWIKYNQDYYKIPVAENGIYQITYSELQNAGIPVGTGGINPKYIQLIHRGKELAIDVSGEDDFQFDPDDYIEFFGQKNDGTLDALLYQPAESQPHPYYNLYSDTTYYFLTWRNDGIDGKRIQTFSEFNVNNLPAELYHWDRKLKIFTNNYSPGNRYPEGQRSAETLLSQFDSGEGWTGSRISKGQSMSFELDSIFNTYTTGPLPSLNILLAGRNNLPHNVIIQVGPSSSNLRIIGTLNFNYYTNYTFSEELQWTDIDSDGDLIIQVTVDGSTGTDPDFVSVSYIELVYPQELNQSGFESKEYKLEENPGGKSYIEITDVSDPDLIWEISQPADIINIGYEETGGNISAIIPNTNTSRKLWVTSNRLSIAEIDKADMRRIEPDNYNYLIVYHKDFTKSAANYVDPISAFASYRASSEGGNFDVLTVEISELYDQFSYGEKTPLSLHNFCMYFTSSGSPDYLLLIGKALTVNYGFYRGLTVDPDLKDWVPTAGYPGSDILFSSANSNGSFGSSIRTGRIPAKSALEVANYLDKVKEADQFRHDEMWKKDLIQLSGGITAGELVVFKRYIDEFKASMEDIYLGGKALNIYKETNNSVELINISEEVNLGKSLVLFFGHSAPNITDIDIGYVSDPTMGYNNKGKYPFMYVNGCNAGNIFSPNLSFGEDWIITGEKGAIGFLAHAGVGYPSQLKRYTQDFISTAYGDSSYIYKTLGAISMESARRYLMTPSPSQINIAQVQQNILQGDPAALLFGANMPDYSLDNEGVYITTFNGEPITTLTDSFQVAMAVNNFGRADTKPFYISISRTLPDGLIQEPDPVRYDPVYYLDTLYFTFKNSSAEGFGLNRFDISIDPFDSIPELRKTNNQVQYDLFITKLGTQNIFPYDYSIVVGTQEQLVAQATDILGDTRQFLFELDTVSNFNSPVRQTTSISGKGVAVWEVDLFTNFIKKDSTVFFWRSKFAEVQPGEEDEWSSYSFTYIENGPEGWAQKSLDQLLQNSANGIEYNPDSKKWEFRKYETTIQATTYGANHPEKSYTDVMLQLNGIPYIYNTRYCTSNSINAIAFDEVTTNPYLVLQFGKYDILDRRSCGRQPQSINNFLNSEIIGSENYLVQYIDAVQTGDYVLIFSIGNLAYSSWPQAVKDKLLEIGASSATLSSLSDGDPYIILGRKGGSEGTAIEILADPASGIPADQQEIQLADIITGQATSGTILTGTIGPSREWYTFFNRISGIDDPFNDRYYFQIDGIDQNMNESLLFNNISTSVFDISGINATQYPYLKLTFSTSDTSQLTPAQITNWFVTYDPMPEGILFPAEEQPVSGIEKQEGEEVEANFVFRNISDKDFPDSLKVIYTVFNQDSRNKRSDSLWIEALPADAEKKFAIRFNTLSLPGINDLDLAVNPRIIPEQYYNNNYLNLKDFIQVNPDNIHPIIDVAFDGRYILDGDIVSPSPMISVKLKDENKILPKSDTTGIDIFIKPPCDECFFTRISFNDPGLTWTPATEKNDFSIEYRPSPLEDGIHTLKVQAADASGNLSGSEPYSIRFEVINESQITNFYPYPNPFSTSTRFVFTLTGSIIPYQYKIQIMTISGKVVREIMQDEIGPIRIGNNITEYAWDGRDEYGDQLANGVYLYRVILNDPGQEFKHRATSGDQGFKKGFGKLYILR